MTLDWVDLKLARGSVGACERTLRAKRFMY
jgi:hypothetical protein